MTDHLDPDRLSDALDRHLPPASDRVSTDLPDDPAVRAASRLATGPKPMLDPAARARMKAQVMAAVPAAARGSPRPILRYAAFVLASAAVTAIALFGLFSALSNYSAGATPTPAAVAAVTETGTATDIAPTATDEPTSTPRPPSATPIVAVTDVPPATQVELTSTPVPPSATPVPPSSTPTVEPSDTPEPTAAPSVTPTVELNVERAARLTLEGVVEAIDGRLLTISGLEIELVEDDPLLEVLRVNDRIRIEGELVRGAHLFNIRAETFVLANDDEADNTVEEGPEGDLWRDPGDCDNPPPPWANANGWRARCEGAEAPGNSSGNGRGSGNGAGNAGGNGNSNGNGGGQSNPNRPENPGNSGGKGNSGN
ncbi:MAG: hypothetical protein IPM16_13175 [Chloroflexi bacterium]|nr:hypothetical protein [Chloroflexota bacterium]